MSDKEVAAESAKETPAAESAAAVETSKVNPADEAVVAEAVAKAEPAKAAEVPAAEAKDAGKKEEQSKQPEVAKTVVPEKYDLKLPDGSLLAPAQVEKIAVYAKAQGLSNDQAQAALERESDAVSTYASSQQELLKQKANEWVGVVKADKELGGEAFGKNVELAKRVLDRYATTEFKNTLDSTGLGNHPELVRVFARIGKTMSEDQLIFPGTQSAKKRSIEDRFYPSTNKES